jgi:hypothetical protein
MKIIFLLEFFFIVVVVVGFFFIFVLICFVLLLLRFFYVPGILIYYVNSENLNMSDKCTDETISVKPHLVNSSVLFLVLVPKG